MMILARENYSVILFLDVCKYKNMLTVKAHVILFLPICQ